MRYPLFLFSFFIVYMISAQHQESVDFKRITARITPDFEKKSILGSVLYEYEIIKDTDSIFIDARVDEVWNLMSNKNLDTTRIDGKLWLKRDFKAGENYELDLVYEVSPKQTLYFFKDQLWTQGQGKYTSYWLPSLDDMTDKIEFDITLVLPPEFNAVANGNLISKDLTPDEIQWNFDMKKPMSSYLVMIAAGKFEKEVLSSASGIPLENYYQTGKKNTVEPTYRYTKEIFDFLENKIGVPYPWANYKQVPVRDFLYAGMENTTATVFSSAFVVDSIGFNDRNYVNVNAHELAHQWFGNLVTEVSAKDHWLHEGFASYYALLAEREIFGDDYYYWKLFNTAEQLRSMSDAGKGQALSDPKASSLTFYEKGTWALIFLDELLGTITFDKVIKAYLEEFAYQNATLDDFFTIAEAVSGVSLAEYRKNWIDQTSFPAMKALNYLSESPFIEAYVELEILRKQELAGKKQQLVNALQKGNEYLGQEAVAQLAAEPIGQVLDLYDLALKSPHLLVRQTVAQSIPEIPIALKNNFEALLKDDSYITREIALFRLWNGFPADRAKYLDRMDGQVGFMDKNIRQLWLTLAIVTPNYKPEKRNAHIEELMSYASKDYSFEVRELALNYLTEIKIVNQTLLRSLANACVHPNWRFRNSARKILKKQLDNPIALKQLKELKPELPQKEQEYLSTVLK